MLTCAARLPQALAEMMKYENAIDADHLEDDRGAINHRVYPVTSC